MTTSLRLSSEERGAVRAHVAREAWTRGSLTYLLHADQRRVYRHFVATTGRYLLEIARRWGKTWLLLVIAFEVCLRKPRTRVVYGAPTLKHLAEFILPTVEKLAGEAPEDLRPRYNSATGHLEFPNGSYIHLFGADDKRKADRGRGSEADLAIFDEAGFTPVLRYVLRSVFRPQLMHTGGRILLASTPAEEPEHQFTELAEKAEVTGNYQRRTIHDNPRLTPEQIRTFIDEDARDEGMTAEDYERTDEFRREYLAERVVDRLLVVVPEWADARAKLIQAVPRPEMFDGLTWLDFGGNDPHAVLFAYWHFELAKVVIEDELLLKGGENTGELATAIKAKEAQLWGVDAWQGTLRAAYDADYRLMRDQLPDWMANAADADAPTQPYARWADNDMQLVRDLYELHGMAFAPTEKHDKELQVNNLRVLISAGQVLVHPRCVHTDRHFRTTTWSNSKRRDYRRIGGEHGDLLDCATYGVRNLYRRNPYPPGWGVSGAAEYQRVMREAKQGSGGLLGNGPLARRLRGR